MTTPISERYGNIHRWYALETTTCPRCGEAINTEHLTVDRNHEVVGCSFCVRRVH